MNDQNAIGGVAPQPPSEWLATVGADGVRQAIGELRGFARAMRRNGATITASQIDCLCDFTAAYLSDQSPTAGGSS